MVKWIDTTTPRTHQRTLVVITDGAPSDQSVAQELYDVAVSYGVGVFAVGLGAAAEDDPPGEAALLLLELAVAHRRHLRRGRAAGRAASGAPHLAQSTSPERLVVRLQLTPIPARGTTINGTVSLSGVRGTVAAEWSFTAP